MAFSRLASGLKSARSLPRLAQNPSRSRTLHSDTLSRPGCHAFPSQRPRVQPFATRRFQSSQLRTPSQDIQLGASRSRPWRRALDMGLGALVLTGIVSFGSLFYFYSGHVVIEKVPLTNRSRMLWVDKQYDEELGHPLEGWLMDQREKPRLREDDPVAKLVRDIMKKLLDVDLTKGLEFKVYIFDDFSEPNAWGGPAQHGGRIFINTGCINECKNPEEVAAVLAHEIGHVIARHTIEQNLKRAFAQTIVRYFGFKGTVGSDLITLRIQEAEADHMGLLIMAQAGFDPQKRVNYLKDRLDQEREWLAGREPLPEFLSTHPSSERRLELAEALMPEASKLFEQKGSIMSEIQGWETVTAQLEESHARYTEQCALNERMAPDVLLKGIDGKLNTLIEVWNDLVDVQRNAVEEALKSKVLEEAVKEVVAQKQARELATSDVAAVEVQDGNENTKDDAADDEPEADDAPRLRRVVTLALAPPPMAPSPPSTTGPPSTEGTCMIPTQPELHAGGENPNMPEVERGRD